MKYLISRVVVWQTGFNDQAGAEKVVEWVNKIHSTCGYGSKKDHKIQLTSELAPSEILPF